MTSPNSSDDTASGRSKLPWIIGTAVAVVVVVAAALFWFLRDDSPDRVNLEDAIESVSTTTPDDASGTDPDGSSEGDAGDAGDAADDDGTEGGGDGAPDGQAGVDGSWTVDTESGEFDYESASGSFVGFRVDEELAGIGETEAVGRTGDVTGSLTIEDTTVTEASFEVDLTTLTTNDGRRDDRVQDALATDEFPTATFALTAPIELPAGADGGETVQATATGDLTVNGVTQPIELPIEARLVESTIVVVGSMELTFSDYGVEVPSAPIVLSASDRGDLELQLLFVRS